MDPLTLQPHHRVHLVGIGGSGMSPLARILLARGHQVSGSDLRGGRAATALQAMGARVHIGHEAAAIEGADVVVVSTAIPRDNPEVVRARELGVPVVRRAELLAALMRNRRALLIAGTHGKTTTTSMVAVALQAAGLDPSFAIGGTLHGAGTSAHHGSGSVFVAEADESDRSFLVYEPDCAVVTNIELDHPDTFADVDEVVAVFRQFLARRRPGAPAILCLDDPRTAGLVAELAAPVITYGEHGDADVRITAVDLRRDGASFEVRHFGADLGTFTIQLAGRHNVANAAAALTASVWSGAAPEAVRDGLARFTGAQRRFQLIGTAGGVAVVDDYGHHPTEITATLSAARQAFPDGRTVVLFQPHRYSRTAAMATGLGQALAAADVLVVTDVYASGETPVPGVTGALVADAAASVDTAGTTEVTYRPALTAAISAVVGLARPGDVVLTLGAGDVTEAGPVVLSALRERSP